jgi:hypothetical protein
MIPMSLRRDRDVALAACSKSRDIFVKEAAAWIDDNQFCQDLVVKNPVILLDWPTPSPIDIVLAAARTVRLWDDYPYDPGHSNLDMEEVLLSDEYSDIFGDRQVVRNVVKHVPYNEWQAFLDKVPLDLLQDRDFMLELCHIDGHAMEYARHFLGDDEIVSVALHQEPHVLVLLPPEFLLAHPDLVIQAVWRYDNNCHDDGFHDEVAEHIPDEIWGSREFVLAWLSSGGMFENDDLQAFSNDREVLLAILEHCPWEFECLDVDEPLFSDKTFMLQVLKHDRSLYRFIDDSLKGDFDILMETLYFDAYVRELVESEEYDGLGYIVAFTRHVRDRIRAETNFVTFQHGLSTERSCLNVLLLGKETTLALKNSVAELVDVPGAEELEQLRSMSIRLLRLGY